MEIIKNTNALVTAIENDYRKYDAELNTLYFEPYEIEMTAQQLLQAYAELQHELNGDFVVCLNSASITFNEGEMKRIEGTSNNVDENFDTFQNIHVSGNAKAELEKLLEANKYHIFRFNDYLEDSETGSVVAEGDLIFDLYF